MTVMLPWPYMRRTINNDEAEMDRNDKTKRFESFLRGDTH